MTPTSPITCPACRAIDRADGVEDGNLYKIEHYHARSGVLLRLMRALRTGPPTASPPSPDR